MRTIEDVERRSDEIKLRINQILMEIAEATPTDKREAFADLAEEMALLLHEAKVLNTSLVIAREITQSLANAECSGPH